MHDTTKRNASVATDIETGRRMPSTTSALTPTNTLPSSIPSLQHSVLLPSPPCSPPRSSGSAASASVQSSHSPAGTTAPMLQAHSTLTTAKLDISLLLKSSPSPPPSSPGAEVPRGYQSRSSSVPPPTTQHFAPDLSQHRPSVSSSATTPKDSRGSRSSIGSRFSSEVQAARQAQTQPPFQRPTLPSLASRALQHSGQAFRGPPSSYMSPSSQQLTPSLLYPSTKRPPPTSPHPAASPAKRQSKWTPDEDALIIELRGSGMKWEEISRRLLGRSAISCRLHYQNYLERRSEWDEERKNRLARLYERLKPEMWGPLAAELGIPWRAAEAMHWQLGEADMARRAGVVPFSLATTASSGQHPATAVPASSVSGLAPGGRYMTSTPEGTVAQGTTLHGLGMRLDEVSPGRLRHIGSFGTRLDERGVPRPETGIEIAAVNPGQPAGHALLPSLAELERGMTAVDDRNRFREIPESRRGRMGRRHADI